MNKLRQQTDGQVGNYAFSDSEDDKTWTYVKKEDGKFYTNLIPFYI